jgi:hypothetical protein
MNEPAIRTIRFSGAWELLQYVDCDATKGRDAREDDRDDFRGASWDESLALLRNGWQAGTADVVAAVDKIELAEKVAPGSYQQDVTGDFFDVGLMLAGQPEHWYRQVDDPVRRAVNVVVNVAASCGVSVDELTAKGAATLALIDKLQEEGFIVDLSCVYVHERRGGVHREKIVVDLGTTPLPMQDASYLIGHIAGYRRTLIAASERFDNRSNTLGWFPWDDPEDLKPGTIYLPSGSLVTDEGIKVSLSTPEAAANWIKKTIESLAAKDAA